MGARGVERGAQDEGFLGWVCQPLLLPPGFPSLSVSGGLVHLSLQHVFSREKEKEMRVISRLGRGLRTGRHGDL